MRPIGSDIPGRCSLCGFHPSMGHRSIAAGVVTGCTDSGPWLRLGLNEKYRAEAVVAARRATEHATPDREWQTFIAAVRADADAHDGLVSQNRVRGAIGYRWTTTNAKRRYSQLWSRARREAVLVETDLTERSTDHAGGNGHRLVPVLRLKSYAKEAAA